MKKSNIKKFHNKIRDNEIADILLEKELITLQLNQAKEELDRFLYNNKCSNKLSLNDIKSTNRYSIYMNECIDGDNWYAEEFDSSGSFRWTGPGSEATIKIDSVPDKDTYLIIEYRNSLVANQLEELEIYINGKLIPHLFIKNRCPKFILLKIMKRDLFVCDHIKVNIKLPYTEAPENINNKSNDNRKLGLCVNRISIIPINEKLYLKNPYINILRSYLNLIFYKLRINEFPYPYFDGISYLEAYPDIALKILDGKYNSAWDYYIKTGFKTTELKLATLTKPNYGTYIDALELLNSIK